MKTHNKYLFVEVAQGSVNYDTTDGYLTSASGERVKLPHRSYTLLGVVDECITAPYAEEFSKEIVSYTVPMQGYGGYCDYGVEAWCYHLDTAKESFGTLMKKLDLKPTDYILRDER